MEVPYNQSDYVTVHHYLTDTSGFDSSDISPDNITDKYSDTSNTNPFDLPSLTASDEPIFWDGLELKKGQIDRLKILKPINLCTSDANNKLVFVRILNPGYIYIEFMATIEYGIYNMM